MKNLFIYFIIVLTVTYAMAAEGKPLKDVDIDTLTDDVQVYPIGAGDNHLAFAWWCPIEFWESILSRDTTTSETDKKAMLDAMMDVSLVAIVQADITHFGAFEFYLKEEIRDTMWVFYTNASGTKQRLSPMRTINPDLEILLGVFKPILGAAMGNMGNSMHFYVFNDRNFSLMESSRRLIDPYRKGLINIQLVKRDGSLMYGNIEMPLNSLFIPRKCPNGKDAHISWKYCPWTGQRLED